ncbi:DNA-binding protein kinase TEL1 [Saccharomyces paradoxus]|uniref:Serine/threonine-protein kinase Tel1 n=1 Tax=Saccharomyces paradoxus TaxID=27291 RepID=A0A8B8UL64_SACPA|nr:Tel1 [Saccharomyces paradoxus]QHS71485.1 Tel1 [Saccharomyces paradoxus]
MEDHGIVETLNLLSSTKIKERNSALDELTTVLKENPERIPTKALPTTADALVELLASEHTKYCELLRNLTRLTTNKLSLSENRLSTISYVLRLFVEKSCGRFKVKTLKLLLAVIPELMVKEGSKSLLDAVSVHLSFALDALIKSDPFKLKFMVHQWTSLVDKICEYFQNQMRISMVNKTLTNFVSILLNLLALDTVGIYQVARIITWTVIDFLKLSKKENGNTRLIMSLINQLILKCHCLSVIDTLMLIKEAWSYNLTIGCTSNELVQDQLSLFDVISSELMNHKLPYMIGQEKYAEEFCSESLVSLYREYILLRLSNYKPQLFTLDCIEFSYTQSSRDENTWFVLHDFRLRDREGASVWLNVFGITKSLLTYFALYNKSENNSLLFKKRKCDSDIPSILRISDDMDTFLIHLLEESRLHEFELLGLQLCSFYGTLKDVTKNFTSQLKELLFSKFEKIQCFNWVCFSFIPLLSQEKCELSNDDMTRLFKVCLPLVKSKESCQISCVLLANSIKFSKQLLFDEKTINQIHDFYELSDILGPISITNESFMLWGYLQHFGKDFQSMNGMSSADRIFEWLKSKWNQLHGTDDKQDQFCNFISWLGNKYDPENPFNDKKRRRTNPVPPCWNESYMIWHHFQEQRKFLLCVKPEGKSKCFSTPFFNLPKVPLNLTRYNETLYRLLENIESDTLSSPLQKFTWAAKLIQIIDNLCGDSTFFEFITAYKRTVSLTIPQLSLDNQNSYESFFEDVLSIHTTNVDHVVLDKINMKKIVNDFIKIQKKKSQGGTSAVNYFEASSEEIAQNNSPYTIGGRFQELQHSAMDKAVQAYLWASKNKSISERLIAILEFSDCITTDVFISYLGTVCQWLKQTIADTSSYNKILEEFTEVLGEKLLCNHYSSSNQAMLLLTSYIEAIRPQWLCYPGQPLNSDCNDILDWIISRFEDNSFTGVAPTVNLSKLLLSLLQHHDLSQGTVRGGKQRVFATFIKCLQKLDSSSIISILNIISNYMAQVSYKNQSIIFSEIKGLFGPPQQSLEKSASYSLTMSMLSLVSYPSLVFSLEDMMTYSSFNHTRAFIRQALNKIIVALRHKNLMELFEYCKFDLIMYWFNRTKVPSAKLEKEWDISLFGFTNIHEFLGRYFVEISAIYFSQGFNQKWILDILHTITGNDDAYLVDNSYYLCIPLAFISGGVNELIFDILPQISGKPTVKYHRKYRLLMLKWIIRFIDLGSLTELRSIVEKLFPTSYLSQYLFENSSVSMRYQYPLHIPLALGASLLQTQFAREKNSTQEFKLLFLSVITDLEKTSTYMGKLRCARELKFLFVLYENVLVKSSTLNFIIIRLSKFLIDTHIHDEIITIFSSLLNLANKKMFKIEASLPNLFCKIFIYLREYKQLSPSFQQAIKLLERWDLVKIKTWKYCLDAIFGHVIQNDIYENTELLDASNCNIDNVVLVSLLFSYAKKPVASKIDCFLSNAAAINILKHHVPKEYLSKNFKLWFATLSRSISREEIEIESTSNFNNELHLKNFEMVFHHPGLPHMIYRRISIFNKQAELDNSTEVFFLSECILTYLVGYSMENSETEFGFTEKLLDENKDKVVPLDKDVLNAIRPLANNFGMESFICDSYLSVNEPYDCWIGKFARGLIHQISFNIPPIICLYPLCKASITFCELVLNDLFFLSMTYDPKSCLRWSSQIFTQIATLLNVRDSEIKLKLLFGVIKMIRMGSRYKERNCLRTYSSLNLEEICQISIKIEEFKFSYLLFEEMNMPKTREMNINTLQKIYESINDGDFIAGLPVPHSIEGVLNSINRIESDTWKRFLFNNANFDANYTTSLEEEKEPLIKATEDSGFYGLTSLLESRLSGSSDVYKWNLELGNWKLLTPKIIDSKAKGLYYAIKNLPQDVSYAEKCLEKSLLTIFDSRQHFTSQNEWMDTLNAIIEFIKIASSSQNICSFPQTLMSIIKADKERLNTIDFYDHKATLKGRHTLMNVLSKNSLEENAECSKCLHLGSIIQLANYIQLAIANGASQDALRNATLMSNMVKNTAKLYEDPSVLSQIEKLASYMSANALWESQEYKAPVMIMRDLVARNEKNTSEGTLYGDFELLLDVPMDQIKARLVKWSSESRLESAAAIYEENIVNWDINVDDHESCSDVFYTLGSFLDEQAQKLRSNGEIEDREHRSHTGKATLKALELIYKNTKLPENERKDAKRHYNRVMLQYNRDSEILKALLLQKEKFLWHALHFYLNTLVFSNRYDNDIIDKFCGLWFENDDNSKINQLLYKEIGTIPSWKFLPWVNQIASKISMEENEFQKPLQLTMKRLLYKLPYDSLYSVMSILLYEKQSNKDTSISQKIQAVKKILLELQGYDKGAFAKKYVLPVQEFCEMSVELANLKFVQNTKKLHLANLKIGQYWLNQLSMEKLPLPMSDFTVKSSADGRKARPYIVSVNETVSITTTGLSLPKIITFNISDGTTQRVLMKGSNDDLRQDAIMEQVFRQVNKVLQNDKVLRNLDLGIRTYKVVPLGPKAGIIEFVANSTSLHQILSNLHKNDKITFDQARKAMKAVQTKSNKERLKTYLKITDEIKPQLRNFFFDSFPDPLDWFEAKKKYTKGVAASSIVGYILGLGDRHLNNILLDCSTGEPIHIDLGIAFDQGKLLPIPELVPFRLTRDIVDGFGVTGVDGLFRRSCERVYAVLRKDYVKVMCVLNILKWDPLYSWVMSPVKKYEHLFEGEHETTNFDNVSKFIGHNDRNENQESYRALKGVEEKLMGNGLSVESSVQDLIQQATDPSNLSVIYMGWSPFY